MELMLPSLALKKSFVDADAFNKKSEPGLAKDTSPKDTEAGSYHAFRIGDIGLLIPQDTICEVAEELAYCQLPNTSTVLYGMANLRGSIIPLFDLHELFGFVSNSKTARKVLIIGGGENTVAVMVSELPIRIGITSDQRLSNLPPIPDKLQPYIKSCYQEDGVWFSWDLDSFFNDINTYIQ